MEIQDQKFDNTSVAEQRRAAASTFREFLKRLDIWDIRILVAAHEDGGIFVPTVLKELEGFGCMNGLDAVRHRIYSLQKRDLLRKVPHSCPALFVIPAGAIMIVKKIIHDWTLMMGLERLRRPRQ